MGLSVVLVLACLCARHAFGFLHSNSSITKVPTVQSSLTTLLAMEDLYDSLDGDNWITNINWVVRQVTFESDPCTNLWYGVICDENLHIVGINLSNNRLKGTIPPSIGNLTFLRQIDMFGNNIVGTLPSTLTNLHLEYLRLGNNSMSGPLPPSLSSQVNLTYLRLSNNFFSGSIPSQWGQMQSLQYLYLHGNALSGQIPASLSNLSSLQRLLIQDNNLNGTIPGQLQELQQLVYLMASNNSLSGTIPAVLGNIGTLLWLTLHDNQLSGAIPEHLDQITGLQRFTCWGNPSMQRRWAPDAYQLGNIDSISVYETQVRRRPLPDLKFF